MKRVAEHALMFAELCEVTVHVLYIVHQAAYGSIPEDTGERVREALVCQERDQTGMCRSSIELITLHG